MKKVAIQTELPLTILREGDAFVAYSPALDISTVGKTYKEAQRRFSELVNIFFEELIEMGTLDEVLIGLGWVKKKAQWVSPIIVSNESILVTA